MKKFNYDNDLYNFIKEEISGKLCFDLGSNIGYITQKLVRFNCKVLAIEPQKNLTINNDNYKGSYIKNVCISNKIGMIDFYKCDKHVSSSCLESWKVHHPDLKWTKIEIPCTTIDELIKEFGIPKYLKLDIENSEYQALQDLSQKIDIISLEYTEGFIENTIKCIDRLESFGIKKIYTFTKKKEKKEINGKLELKKSYNIVTEFENKNEIISFLKSLPKLKRKCQGDLL